MNISPLVLKDCKKAEVLHRKGFLKGWEEKTFREFLEDPFVAGMKVEENQNLYGYILWREILDEAEILTLVVDAPHRRKGIGYFLVDHLSTILKEKGVARLFLEVAEDNEEGLSLYAKCGFIFLSKRPHYYPRKVNRHISALNFVKNLV